MKIVLSKLESEYNYWDIVYFRKCAVAQLRKELRDDKPVMLRSEYGKTTQKQKKKEGGLFSKKSKSAAFKPSFMNETDKNKLFSTVGNIDVFETENSSESKKQDLDAIPNDFDMVRVEFDLVRVELALLDVLQDEHTNGDQLLQMLFDDMRVRVNIRPKSNILVTTQLQNMVLNDYYSKDIIQRSMIIRSDLMTSNFDQIKASGDNGKDNKLESSKNVKELSPLIDVSFELNPLDKIADFKLLVVTRPMIVDLHIPVFMRLVTFFLQEGQADLQVFERAALRQLEAMKKFGFVLCFVFFVFILIFLLSYYFFFRFVFCFFLSALFLLFFIAWK